jgi:hypothetical protein
VSDLLDQATKHFDVRSPALRLPALRPERGRALRRAISAPSGMDESMDRNGVGPKTRAIAMVGRGHSVRNVSKCGCQISDSHIRGDALSQREGAK